ncbi:MAG: hypothetical protein ACRENK_15545 [Gemmatimonadaceae bacterium]
MTKAKAKPKSRVRAVAERAREQWHDHVAGAARRHPVITLSSIALFVGIMVSLGPAALWALNYYETRTNAHIQYANFTRLMAWSTVQSVKTEVVALRNRVNDCDIAKDNGQLMSDLEHKACAQYYDEFKDAQQRFVDVRKTASDLSK